jgi:hypothetical protein
MKKLILATFILSYALWSCSGSGGGGDDTPTPKTLADSVNYTNFVKPIMTKNCNLAGCHSQGAGGIDLRTYSKVFDQVTTGKLIAAINHGAGAKPMPQGAAKLSSRDILIIETWKTKGCPEN